jgi:hypothetical protein
VKDGTYRAAYRANPAPRPELREAVYRVTEIIGTIRGLLPRHRAAACWLRSDDGTPRASFMCIG